MYKDKYAQECYNLAQEYLSKGEREVAKTLEDAAKIHEEAYQIESVNEKHRSELVLRVLKINSN